MAEFAQFEDHNPIMRDISIASAAKGYEAWSEVLGKTSQDLVHQAMAMQKEERDAMFLQAQNQVSEVVTQAKVQLAEHPGMGNEILKNTKYTIGTIKAATHPKDQESLQSVINSHLGGFEVAVAHNNFEQSNLRIQTTLYDTLPQALEDLSNEFNPEIFMEKSKKIEGLINNSFGARAITPLQHANFIKMVHGVYDRHQAITNMAKDPNVDAKIYQAITGISFTNDDRQNAGSPINANTQLLYDHYNTEQTIQAATALAESGVFPNAKLLSHLPENEFNKVQFTYLGAMQGKGLVNSHEAYPAIENRLSELSNKQGLSDTERGELNYLKNYTTSLNQGNYLSVIGGTPEGGKIVQDFNQNKVAIENSYFSGTPEQSARKQRDALNANLNDYINKNKSLAIGSHTPMHLINLVPKEIASVAQDSFILGHDPSSAINTLYTLDRPNQYWLAKEMKNPIQKEAIYGSGLLRNVNHEETPSLFMSELVRAAQSPRDDSLLKIGESGEDTKIKYELAANLSNELGFVGLQPSDQRSQDAIVQLGLNWIKDHAKAHGDLEIKNYSQYAKDFAKQYSQGYNLIKGYNYQFNLNELNVTRSEADALSYYELDRAYQVLTQLHGSNGAQTMVDLRPLMVTNTRDGHIIVTDLNGNILVDDFYDHKVKAMAEHTVKKNREELSEQFEKTRSANESLLSGGALPTTGGY